MPDYAAELQEFEAGALPALKELVLALPGDGRVLVAAVDDRAQRHLPQLFGAHRAAPPPAPTRCRWWTLTDGQRLTRARLDLCFTTPRRIELRVLFALPDSAPLLRRVAGRGRVLCVDRRTFAGIEQHGRISHGILAPIPPPVQLLDEAPDAR